MPDVSSPSRWKKAWNTSPFLPGGVLMRVPQWLGMSPWSSAEQSGPWLGFLGISFKWLTTIPIYIYIIHIYIYIYICIYIYTYVYVLHIYILYALKISDMGYTHWHSQRMGTCWWITKPGKATCSGWWVSTDPAWGSHRWPRPVAAAWKTAWVTLTRRDPLRIFFVHEILRIFSEWIIMCTSFGISYHAEI